MVKRAMVAEETFQSTLSVRRATCCCRDSRIGFCSISIHALREESDVAEILGLRTEQFQSTLSVRRATSISETWR